MLKTIDYITEFRLTETHEVRFLSLGGFFTDTFEVYIDGHKVLGKRISWLDIKQQFWLQTCEFYFEGHPAKILWQWNWRNGDPLYIALSVDNRIVAEYGNIED